MKTLILLIAMATVLHKTLNVKSPAFNSNSPIPVKYTCKGDNVNPPLQFGNIPAEAKSMALIIEDPDAPSGTFDHWIMWNMPVKDRLDENSAPGTEGKNGKQESKYTGPCPPSGIHHYHFKVYALDTDLSLPAGADKQSLHKAMQGHILAEGELIGTVKH